jgi:hypothetical protein
MKKIPNMLTGGNIIVEGIILIIFGISIYLWDVNTAAFVNYGIIITTRGEGKGSWGNRYYYHGDVF